jgi:phage terminase large subunit-like protein
VFTPPLRELTPATSKGFACVEFAEAILEIPLLPWQRWLLIAALELLPDGSYRFRTVVLLVARQNGKSTLMLILALWSMFAEGAPLVIGTAQNLDIAEELWTAAYEMAESIPELAVLIDHVDKTNGKKALRLVSGERYKVATASRRGGRGLTGDLVLLDELREHQTFDAWGAVTKTTRTRSQAQIWAASNAGDGSSVVLKHLRLLAHIGLGDPDGIAGESAVEADTALGIFEWSAPPGCDVRDRDGWAAANPSMGHLPSMERSIAADAAIDPERVFRTEVLCQWVDSMHEGAFPGGVWEANIVGPDVMITGKPVVAVDTRSGMQQSAAILVAGATSENYDLVEVAQYELGKDIQWAHDYLVVQCQKILSAHKLDTVVVDKFGDNATLIQALEDAGITVTKLDTTDMRNAATGFQDALINGRVKHKSEAPLNVAVLGAGKRVSGEKFLWSQARSVTDITPLRAATAAWWVLQSREVDYDILDSVF